ncbi:MAG: GntR family transcriptional regulator [Burkholderiales bacterium]
MHADRSTRESPRQANVAYQRIKAEILDGTMPPGHQALEPELALRLGMSRTPVREALVRLQNEGFVELVPRRGMRVARLSVRDIKEISEVLAVLETEAAERLASRKLPPDVLAQFDAAIASMDRALEAKDIDAWNKADYSFHLLLIHACGNRHLIEVAERFLERANRYRLMTSTHRAPPVYSNVNHAAVVEAIRRGDPQSAVEIHRSHKRRWMRELDGILARLDPDPSSSDDRTA